ncbi:MAG: hypothetical protein NT149_02295 [Candidatus Gottesmanbacteria bacterium]|nr:hypothetical protein [Candidatus Gottesmanbacteria bacterium]
MPNIKQAFFRFLGLFDGIREINTRYKVPRIKMTPMVRFWLVFLRIYLVLTIAILIYKFIVVSLSP